MNSFWSQVYFHNSVRDWFIALAIIVGGIIVLRIIQAVVVSWVQKFATRTASTFDDFLVVLIRRIAVPYFYLATVFAAAHYLVLPPAITRVFQIAWIFISVFFVVQLINSLISYTFRRFTKSEEQASPQYKQARGILIIVRTIIWFLGILFLIDNLGYNISTILAGLGVGGIAIALAAQTVLGDLFSYLVIFFDKPFENGDFIAIGDKMGSVEYIGIKTTRLRTPGGEQLIMSNTDLTNSRVQNYKRMMKRRVLFTIGVEYATDPEKIKRIPQLIKASVLEQEGVEFERSHFSGFGDFSLKYETVYHVLNPDFGHYMDVHQNVSFSIMDKLRAEEIEFAFPTQKVLMSGELRSEVQGVPPVDLARK